MSVCNWWPLPQWTGALLLLFCLFISTGSVEASCGFREIQTCTKATQNAARCLDDCNACQTWWQPNLPPSKQVICPVFEAKMNTQDMYLGGACYSNCSQAALEFLLREVLWFALAFVGFFIFILVRKQNTNAFLKRHGMGPHRGYWALDPFIKPTSPPIQVSSAPKYSALHGTTEDVDLP